MVRVRTDHALRRRDGMAAPRRRAAFLGSEPRASRRDTVAAGVDVTRYRTLGRGADEYALARDAGGARLRLLRPGASPGCRNGEGDGVHLPAALDSLYPDQCRRCQYGGSLCRSRLWDGGSQPLAVDADAAM